MNQNLVELRPVLLLRKANFSIFSFCRTGGDHSVITVAKHSAADHSFL